MELKNFKDLNVKHENYVFVKGTPNKANFKFKGKNIQFNSFYMSKFLVTNAEFAEFLNAVGNLKGDDNKPYFAGNQIKQISGKWVVNKGMEDFPAVYMSWYGADAYCKWIGGALPSEAQWEYAAKGGQESKGYLYSGSNTLNEVGWNLSNSGGRIHKGGELKANELGLFDMSGNCWEWTADWFDESYKGVPEGACDFRGASTGKRGS